MDDLIAATTGSIARQHVENVRDVFKIEEVVEGFPSKFLGMTLTDTGDSLW